MRRAKLLLTLHDEVVKSAIRSKAAGDRLALRSGFGHQSALFEMFRNDRRIVVDEVTDQRCAERCRPDIDAVSHLRNVLSDAITKWDDFSADLRHRMQLLAMLEPFAEKA